MYYCSIEDAWGNNLKNNSFNYNSEPTKTQETIYNSVNNYNDKINNIDDQSNDNIDDQSNDNIDDEYIEIEKSKIKSINNKKILLEKKIKKLQNKKNKFFKMQNKIKGGNNNSDLNNCIILGLLLLFIIDYFGHLSY